MRVTVLLVAAALALPSPAAAKELTNAQVCGQSGCAALPRDGSGDGLVQLRGSEGRETVAPPKAAPYYRLSWEFSRRIRFTTLYVPSADLVAAPGPIPRSVEWFGASERVLARVRSAASDLEPFAAPKRWSAGALAATQVSSPKPSNEPNWIGWSLGAGSALLALAAAIIFARRLRIRHLRPAA